MNDKDKFWMVAFVNGIVDVIRTEDGKIQQFNTIKQADNAAKDKAKELGEGYKCFIMESLSFWHGYMTADKVFCTTNSSPSEIPE